MRKIFLLMILLNIFIPLYAIEVIGNTIYRTNSKDDPLDYLVIANKMDNSRIVQISVLRNIMIVIKEHSRWDITFKKNWPCNFGEDLYQIQMVYLQDNKGKVLFRARR